MRLKKMYLKSFTRVFKMLWKMLKLNEKIIFVYHHSVFQEETVNDNFGDLLGPYIVKKLTSKKMVKVKHPSMRRYKYFLSHFLTVGSILEIANENSIVWGSGLIRSTDKIRKCKFLAVRGPLTRQFLVEDGHGVPEIYGDPAILLGILFKQAPKKKYPLGIIPHYVDRQCLNKFENESIIIDLMTNDIEDTIKAICDYEFIVSSSLHGIIVAHSYGIPALWVKFSDNLAGDDIKFFDYLKSIEIEYSKVIKLPDNISYHKLLGLKQSYSNLLLPNPVKYAHLQQQLLKSAPF